MSQRAAGWILALALTALAGSAAAQEDRVLTNRVGYLYDTTQADLNAEIDALARDTGVELYVIFISWANGQTMDEVALEQAIWDRPGEQALLLVAAGDRLVRIETEGPLAQRPDAVWARLIEAEMLPYLRRGQQATATRRGVAAIDRELRGQPARLHIAPHGHLEALRDMAFVLLAGFLAAMSFDRMRKERLWRAKW